MARYTVEPVDAEHSSGSIQIDHSAACMASSVETPCLSALGWTFTPRDEPGQPGYLGRVGLAKALRTVLSPEVRAAAAELGPRLRSGQDAAGDAADRVEEVARHRV